jgi:CRISP-associated protein Cas1
MAFVYVTQQGAILRKSGDRFLIEHDERLELDIPYHRLEHILLFGNVQVTTQAVAEALDKGIAISFFTRHGRFRGGLQGPNGKNVTLRLNQYRLYDNHVAGLNVARRIVRRKILNGLNVLKRYDERRAQAPTVPVEHEVMQQMSERALAAASIAELQGCEGAAAKSYFDCLMNYNRSAFKWPGRLQHPAKDPLNALLSLAYTLLVQELTALAEGEGLDTEIGSLHEIDGSRPSLALDLVEPFRHPVADRFVMTQVNRSVFQPDDFETGDDHGSLFLKPASMRRFFENFEKWMLDGQVSFRERLRKEVEFFGAFLRKGPTWEPFAFDDPETTA